VSRDAEDGDERDRMVMGRWCWKDNDDRKTGRKRWNEDGKECPRWGRYGGMRKSG